ncbi:cystathionine gamma-synthase [Azospirillum sp. YIM B02556]|uniref:Cystathionine gamma-synthase n=1 Tax=Azospirillum endophyticum TaxID=2800326 RepID=A0ABS1FHR8_9PROT|nr:cystathionine gamma-synthase [Azospirillum endophyticum]MBK1842955.1 cystathionine gamma-synthase [Azospirillum endophyticum]
MKTGKTAQTIAAANGIASDAAFGAVTPPIYLSTTYRFPGFKNPGSYEYSRMSNPTRDQLADTLAQLEGGCGAVITATGMAAVDLLLATLDRGQLVVAPHDCYGGTHRLLSLRAAKGHFDVAFVDQNSEAELTAVLGRRPALVLIESPSNPLLRVTDIARVAERSKAVGAKVAVDNTFLSPALQQPLALGADFAIHSTTKYLNGHSDVVGGAVIAADPQDLKGLEEWANATGITGAPFDAYLTLRGLRTLFPRLEHQQRNASAVADFLDRHSCVDAVHYPGLPSHPGHATAVRQQRGFGAMVSFNVKGGTDGARRFVEAVKLFTLAESLGGVESLVAHPATMTHASMDAEARRVAGIDDSLLRLSVGLEGEADLLADLDQALQSVASLPDRAAP